MVTKASVVVAVALSAVAAAGSSKKTCVVKHTKNSDDTPAILDAFSKCQKDGNVVFSKGVTYNAWTPFAVYNLSNVIVNIDGNIDLPKQVSVVQQKINSTANPHPLMQPLGSISKVSDRVQLIGSKSKSGGQFNGYGQQWWDNGIRILRPQLATFNVTNGYITRLKVIKPVAWGWNIPGKNILIEDHFNITLNGYWGENGDDCVSVVNGARNIVAKNGYCGFSSHGLSVGSLGRNGANHTVANVLFDKWTMEGAVYAARFKSWTGGNGFAENVTWSNIRAINVSTAAFVTQNYYDQDKGPRPGNQNKTSTRITNLTFKNFEGYLGPNWTDGTCISEPCWNYVEGGDTTQSIILDLYNGTATGLKFRNFKVHPYKKGYDKTTVICDPATLHPEDIKVLGFKCVRGPYQPTA
ncbi:glycosyl hydrolase 28 family [Rhizoctonia solani]|uniref:galacturonan 1,4-alpha-galacturonidase n=1 Tax=Rhizoctonia solani TaxID=456999 RepID=A0A8H7M2X7_9AGAM|nr:glycosyl hydrolase 28 family [Rhizoctonia solani]